MPQKGKLAVFESSNISKTGEATSTKIGVHIYISSIPDDVIAPAVTCTTTLIKLECYNYL